MAKNKETAINRIYQGRATACKNIDGKPIEKFEKILLEHHQIFQDAVNYYLCALIAMSQEQDEVFGKIRKQLMAVWNDFDRNGIRRKGVKHSIFRIYHDERILDPEKGFSYVEELLLDHTTVRPEIYCRKH